MLPPHCPGVSHIIKLKNNTKLLFSPIYTYNKEELRCKKKMINKLLYRDWIRPLKSFMASNIIFTKYYHNKKLQIYINYYTLNNNTIKDRYPFPLINKTLQITAGTFYLTRINL